MKKKTLKQIKSSIRKKQIKDGFFDGRFVERTVPDKKKVQDKKLCRLKITFEKE
ncbi:MAG: hypothetical protein JWN78_740 [Bacteroidota bacterium]|nr:hypothetical protein [Bacteroidota bacterium]